MDVSGIALNRSTYEERHKNIHFLRSLYFFLVIEVLIALGWSVWCRENTDLGNWVVRYWGIALVTSILAVLLILLTMFVPATHASPVNFIVYGLFTLCFAYTWGFLCAWDQRHSGWDFLFYWLCLLSAISVALYLQAW